MTFKPRMWRWDDAVKALVVAVLLELLIVGQYGRGGMTTITLAMGAGLVVVVLCFLPDLKALSVGSALVSLSKRGLVLPRRRSRSAPIGAISSLRLRLLGCDLCGDDGRTVLPIGTGWTEEQYRALAELLAVPVYDHRIAFGLLQRRSGRLLFDPGQSSPPS